MDKPSVAVIAIHGVGDHQAGATSAMIAAQLQRFFPKEFGAFECTPLHIAVDTVQLPIPSGSGSTATSEGHVLPQGVRARAASPVQDSDSSDIAFTGAWRQLMRSEAVPPRLQSVGLPLIWLVAVSIPALGIASHTTSSVRAPDVAFFLSLALALALGTAVVRRYEISRPGAATWSWVMFSICALWGIFSAAQIWAKRLPLDWLDGLVFFVEGNFVWLMPAWGALAAMNLWLLTTGMLAKVRSSENDAVRRSIDTSFVAAAVPAPLLLIVVLTLWSGVWWTLDARKFALMEVPVSMRLVGVGTVSKLMQQLIMLSASPAALPFLLCLAAALVCVVLAIIPSVLAELFPKRKSTDDDRSHALWEARSLALWRWLNQGFGLLRLASWIAVFAFFILLPAGGRLEYLLEYLGIPTQLPHLGIAIGGTALTFLVVTRVFGAMSLGKLPRALARLRVVIDTVIDVDNWLRERPVGQTPRLRIVARYVSLLRHLQRQGYSRIVVVSHSQGSVITVDLLRYLRARNPDFLNQFNSIDLLTFGSPLRQLYAARFPALYGWASKLTHVQALGQVGVTNWWNGYRSGDYVGRDLWLDDVPAWQPGRTETRKEFCTGALAHTHYFDEYSPDVAAAIRDTLVGAIPSAQSVPAMASKSVRKTG